MSEHESTQPTASSTQSPPDIAAAPWTAGTSPASSAGQRDATLPNNAAPAGRTELLEATEGPNTGPVREMPRRKAQLPATPGDVEDETNLDRWRVRGARLRGASKARTEGAVKWASKESTRKAAFAAGGLLAATVVAAIQEHRTGQPAPPLRPRGWEPASDIEPATTGPSATFYPTPQRQLRLDGTDRFVEWPHHEIAGLVVGVTPTSGLAADQILVRWDPYIPEAIVIEERTLSQTWRRPFDHRPAVPVQLRLIEPGLVGFRFLDPGGLRTGLSTYRPQRQVTPLGQETLARMMAERHGQAMTVIRNLRA